MPSQVPACFSKLPELEETVVAVAACTLVLLFSLHINDRPERLGSPSFLFADDVKVVGSDGRTEPAREVKCSSGQVHVICPSTPERAILSTRDEGASPGE
ncbi:unnamed protein product [Echinostoma caproni]|uniref:Uncharacterized protein n=1 Tax=Echinostoma caproni TaxID=27848 RepID=A0A183AU28_9TREM|nr:unnamed protein product [Echinostoma caproni]